MNSYGTSALTAAVIAFFVTLIVGKLLHPLLVKLKFGQTILEIGPSWHKGKQGIPTMGGISFIVGILAAAVFGVCMYYQFSAQVGFKTLETPLMRVKIFAGLGMALVFGLIGFADDYVKVRKKANKGLSAIQKLLLQFAAAGTYLYTIYCANETYGASSASVVKLPFLGSYDLGIFYWIISAVVIVGIVNAANLNDGIDGLCSSVAFFIGIFYMIISGLLGMSGMSICSSALTGGCLAFLFWNFHPAKMFMGDTGSLFLGGLICALGFGVGLPIILIILAFCYILEMFSVIVQVLYFKATHGKRLFKMSPIHHHFEMIGWSEEKICFVFSLATIFLGIISTLLVIYSF